MNKISTRCLCFITVSLTAISAGLTASCSFLPEEEEILAPPLMEPATIEYRTRPVERGTLVQEVRMSGSFNPETQQALAFEKQGGRIREVHVKAGEIVAEGDLLIELDSENLEFQIMLQEIEVEKAELGISQLRSANADRYAVRRAELDLRQQEIRLDDLHKQLEATKMYAPFAGSVTYISSQNVGDYVAAYQIVARIADISSLVLVTTSDRAQDLPIGAEVDVEYNREVYKGEVIANPSSMFNDPDERLRRAAIIRLKDDIPDDIRLGSDARITYVQEEREDVLIVSRNHINLMSGRRYVNVLEDDIRVEKDVEIGLMTDTQAEIISGLEEGDLIIVN